MRVECCPCTEPSREASGAGEGISTAQKTVPPPEGLTDYFQKQHSTESCPEQLSRQAGWLLSPGEGVGLAANPLGQNGLETRPGPHPCQPSLRSRGVESS